MKETEQLTNNEQKPKSETAIVKFIFYFIFFLILNGPFIWLFNTAWQWLSLSAVLAHFSSQLNSIINKK